MREFDSPPKPGSLDEPDRLLDELESIKDLLDQEGADEIAGDIPLLDDLVIDLPPQPALLDIGGIFDDRSDDDDEPVATVAPTAFQFPKFTLDVAISDDPPPEPAAVVLAATTAPTAALSTTAINEIAARATRPNAQRDYRRELLIQELVDEFIPQIEAALHERLSSLDDAALLALKDND